MSAAKAFSRRSLLAPTTSREELVCKKSRPAPRERAPEADDERPAGHLRDPRDQELDGRDRIRLALDGQARLAERRQERAPREETEVRPVEDPARRVVE